MTVKDQITKYISSLPGPKKGEIQLLHERIFEALPGSKLWFIDGKNDEGKIIANPNIGYGQFTIRYADGTSREFFQIGLSANKTGISVYVMGLKDKTYLSKTYGDKIGKASITGYCIKFKKPTDINLNTLLSAIIDGYESTKE